MKNSFEVAAMFPVSEPKDGLYQPVALSHMTAQILPRGL